MAKFTPSVIEYLGRIEPGVLVLISIVYQENHYESTFFYTKDQMVLTTSEELESKLGYSINQDPEYNQLILDVLKRVIPYTEIYNRIDEVDFSKWSNLIEEEVTNQDEVEYLDDVEVQQPIDDQNESSS
jgi:hypothetical protein